MLPSLTIRRRRFIQEWPTHFPYRLRLFNRPPHPLQILLAMTLTDLDPEGFEAEQSRLTYTPRHFSRIPGGPKRGDFRLHQAYRGCHKRIHGPQVLALTKMARKGVDVLTPTADGCSRI